jgi:hypothetical protein
MKHRLLIMISLQAACFLSLPVGTADMGDVAYAQPRCSNSGCACRGGSSVVPCIDERGSFFGQFSMPNGADLLSAVPDYCVNALGGAADSVAWIANSALYQVGLGSWCGDSYYTEPFKSRQREFELNGGLNPYYAAGRAVYDASQIPAGVRSAWQRAETTGDWSGPSQMILGTAAAGYMGMAPLPEMTLRMPSFASRVRARPVRRFMPAFEHLESRVNPSMTSSIPALGSRGGGRIARVSDVIVEYQRNKGEIQDVMLAHARRGEPGLTRADFLRFPEHMAGTCGVAADIGAEVMSRAGYCATAIQGLKMGHSFALLPQEDPTSAIIFDPSFNQFALSSSNSGVAHLRGVASASPGVGAMLDALLADQVALVNDDVISHYLRAARYSEHPLGPWPTRPVPIRRMLLYPKSFDQISP